MLVSPEQEFSLPEYVSFSKGDLHPFRHICKLKKGVADCRLSLFAKFILTGKKKIPPVICDETVYVLIKSKQSQAFGLNCLLPAGFILLCPSLYMQCFPHPNLKHISYHTSHLWCFITFSRYLPSFHLPFPVHLCTTKCIWHSTPNIISFSRLLLYCR